MEFVWCKQCGEEPAWNGEWCSPCFKIYRVNNPKDQDLRIDIQKYLVVTWRKTCAPRYWRSPNRPGGSIDA